MNRRILVPTILALLALVVALAVAGVALRSDTERRNGLNESVPGRITTSVGSATTPAPVSPSPPDAFSLPQQQFALYEPPAEELYINGKRLAGRTAQELATFPPGATVRELANNLVAAAQRRSELERTVAPLRDPSRRSAGEVLYVQLSGVTTTTLGAMVVVRQHLEDAAGVREQVVRVMDVRLRRANGPWSLDSVASVGGTRAPRPAKVSAAAARALDHARLQLPDTARWDIHRGRVDDALLTALADAADRWPIAVSVLRTGHPRNVWATNRASAHTSGYAADVYAVDGELVLRQRQSGSSAQRLAAALLAGGARQIGSPWALRSGNKQSFTDRVHQDHVHLQQTATPPPRG